MATNFSPCKGCYVLNQFPSNVMFGMNGFHVSASGAIQGHHGPLFFFFLTKRVTPIFGVLPSANFPQQRYFPEAVNFSPGNQFSILYYKVFLHDLVNKPLSQTKRSNGKISKMHIRNE